MTFDGWQASRDADRKRENDRVDEAERRRAAQRQGIREVIADAIKAIREAGIRLTRIYATEYAEYGGRQYGGSRYFTGVLVGSGWLFVVIEEGDAATRTLWVLTEEGRMAPVVDNSGSGAPLMESVRARRRFLRPAWAPSGEWIAVQGEGRWSTPTTAQLKYGIMLMLKNRD
ncbi:hypothetical protein [Rathayibacter sp. Leaf248]|uniref:hypothetical protein n=1 Tax=Rathayibacter sp. Leaf248 TaxID=2876555 RepID=UPI001E5FDD77|nr:hypothetical protein [Rathayibacter sp. Leaf248]